MKLSAHRATIGDPRLI